jgi:hypothetical protein
MPCPSARFLFSSFDGVFIYDVESHVSQLYIEGPLSIPESENKPQSFVLHSAYPNPFNASTTISFSLAAQSNINLFIYDITGRKINHLEWITCQPGRSRRFGMVSTIPALWLPLAPIFSIGMRQIRGNNPRHAAKIKPGSSKALSQTSPYRFS